MKLQSLEFSEEVQREIYERTGGVPLAIKWAIGQLKQRGQSLDFVLDSLYHAQGDLFASVLERAWDLLSDDARRILVILPLFSSSFSREIIAAATDLRDSVLNAGLGQLVEMWLVEPNFDARIHGGLQYSVHPLVRAYAVQRQTEFEQFASLARIRLIDYYRDFARVYGGNELGSRSRYDRLAEELENIQSVLEWCLTDDHWEQGKEIADSLMTLLSVDGYWEMRTELCRKFIGIAGDKEDELGKALFLGRMAFILAYRGDYTLAWNAAEQILSTTQSCGVCEAKSLAWDAMSLVLLWSERGDAGRAWEIREQALVAHHAAGDTYWTAIDHLVLGKIAIETMRYASAEEHLQNALKHARQIDYQKAQGQALSELGYLFILTNRIGKARECLSEALVISSDWRDLRVQALTKWYQSKLEIKEGNRRAAMALAREAREIAVRLGMKREISMIDNDIVTMEKSGRHWLNRLFRS